MTTNNTTTLNNLPSNCIMEILTYAGNPQNARVCKKWQIAQQDSYRQIFNLYRKDATLSPFIPETTDQPSSTERALLVKQTYQTVIEKAVTRHIGIDLRTAPIALNSVSSAARRIEDNNLVLFFSRLEKAIPENKRPTLTDSLAEKAAAIRLWMENNQTVLAQIRDLDLTNLGLTTLPKEIGRFVNLQRLDLASNKLSTLPKEITLLAKLRRLYLRDNRFSALPLEITQLGNLQGLYLAGNNLTTLPKEIAQLKNLQRLYLTGNHLTTLPKEIGELGSLCVLQLAGNHLTTLPKEIGQLLSLETLHLSKNPLTPLPREIGQLHNLRLLYLDNTPCTTLPLPLEIKQLPNLTIYY